jgi:hypothetical protein
MANGESYFPISENKLKRWHEKMDALDALRVAIQNLPVSQREKDELRDYTKRMKGILDYVRVEMRDKVEGQKMRDWKF